MKCYVEFPCLDRPITYGASSRKVKGLDYIKRNAKRLGIQCIELRQENGVYMQGALRVFFKSGHIFNVETQDYEALSDWIRACKVLKGSILHHKVYGQSMGVSERL